MRAVSLSIWLLLALLAGPASAQDCVAPPGTAAIEEYCELVPGAAGAQPSSQAGSRADSASPQVSAPTLRALDDAGPAGRELSRHLSASQASGSRARSSAQTRRHRAHRQAPPRGADVSDSASPLGAVKASVASGDSVGGGFAWVLLAIAAVLGAAGWWMRNRRRRAG